MRACDVSKKWVNENFDLDAYRRTKTIDAPRAFFQLDCIVDDQERLTIAEFKERVQEQLLIVVTKIARHEQTHPESTWQVSRDGNCSIKFTATYDVLQTDDNVIKHIVARERAKLLDKEQKAQYKEYLKLQKIFGNIEE